MRKSLRNLDFGNLKFKPNDIEYVDILPGNEHILNPNEDEDDDALVEEELNHMLEDPLDFDNERAVKAAEKEFD